MRSLGMILGGQHVVEPVETLPDALLDAAERQEHGVVLYDYENPRTLQELIQQADESMYRHKRHSHQ